jgi:predicted small lipoprotein YifL
MNRMTLIVACLATLTLAACGDGGKKPMTVRDKSSVKPLDTGGGQTKSMVEGADTAQPTKP